MQRHEQIRVIKGLMAHLDNDTNVDAGGWRRNPVASYTCPERPAQEWQHFFQNYAQVLGFASELPQAGAFFTSEDLRKPILCTRDHQGQFRLPQCLPPSWHRGRA